MCEWCDRLCMRNYKWDHHADFRGMWWMFHNTMKSKWHKDWANRKEWHRAESWVEQHKRTSPYYGLGSRYWSTYK